jgi:hypothetical protein
VSRSTPARSQTSSSPRTASTLAISDLEENTTTAEEDYRRATEEARAALIEASPFDLSAPIGLLERIDGLQQLTGQHPHLSLVRWFVTFFRTAVDSLPGVTTTNIVRHRSFGQRAPSPDVAVIASVRQTMKMAASRSAASELSSN